MWYSGACEQAIQQTTVDVVGFGLTALLCPETGFGAAACAGGIAAAGEWFMETFGYKMPDQTATSPDERSRYGPLK